MLVAAQGVCQYREDSTKWKLERTGLIRKSVWQESRLGQTHT